VGSRADAGKPGDGLAIVTALACCFFGPAKWVRTQQSLDSGQSGARLMGTYQVVPNVVYSVASGAEQRLDIY